MKRWKKPLVSLVLVFLCGTLIVLLPVSGRSEPFTPKIALAAGRTCPDIVQAALKAVDTNCSTTGRNSACYGNVRVDTTAQDNAPKFTFGKPGDKVPLKNIRTLRLSSLSGDSADWGIALMRVQANLPDTATGQNVTMLLFGNVQINDGSQTAIKPTEIPKVVVDQPPLDILPTFVPTPTVQATTAATQAATVTPRVTARPSNTPRPSATPRPTSTPRPSPTPTTVPAGSTAYKTMQAFYFSSGVGDPACKEAPQDGILIQSPGGPQKIDLMVDEARIVLGSTVFLQAQASGFLTISTLEGSATVSAFGGVAVAQAGSRVRVPLDANLRASGPPTQPEPYDLTVMQPLPAQHMPIKVTPAAPVAALPAGFVSSTWLVTYGPWRIRQNAGPDTRCVDTPIPATYVTLATNPDGSSILWNGTSYSKAGAAFAYDRDLHNAEPTHHHTEFRLTSATEGDGFFTSIYVSQHCEFAINFHLQRIGAADTAPATPAATATP